MDAQTAQERAGKKPMKSDAIYATPRAEIDAFAFDDDVADVFPDMIGRSVPGYGSVLSMLGVLAREYVQPGSTIYDLGCSLGASSLAIQAGLETMVPAIESRIMAVDNAPAMVDRFRAMLAGRDKARVPVEVVLGDVADIPVEHASLVVLNYTLQFIEPVKRAALLTRLREGMLPGGALLLSEKVCFDNGDEQHRLTELHHGFKRFNGYSELEISQKRSALENVLIPDTIATHHARLQEAGFSSSTVWFQCFNFVSIVALR